MNSPAPWINEAILTWEKEGIALQQGALETYIAEMENCCINSLTRQLVNSSTTDQHQGSYLL